MSNKQCLNCGTELLNDSNFCHNCGQSAATGRLTARNFTVHALSGITRVNKNFLNTVRYLIFTPWKVIRDYVYGKRARYTGPIQMLIVLTFLMVVYDSIVGRSTAMSLRAQDFTFLGGEGFAIDGVNATVRYLMSSYMWMYILALVPVAPVVWAVHRMGGIRKFNSAEYLVAAIYAACAIIVINLCFMPLSRTLDWLGVDSTILVAVQILVAQSVLVIGLYKSFSSSGKRPVIKIAYIAVFFLLCFVVYLLLLTVMIFIHEVTLHPDKLLN